MLVTVALSVPKRNAKNPNNFHWLSLCNPACSFATHYNDLQPATSICNLPQFCIKGGVVRQKQEIGVSLSLVFYLNEELNPLPLLFPNVFGT